MVALIDPLEESKARIRELLEIDKRAKSHVIRTPDCSLSEFIHEAWPVIEPMTPLVWGWYLDAICDHLEAVTNGQIRNLIINVPPRFSKSSIVSVMWPCWAWTFNPETKWLFSSYGAALSERDSLKCRRLIQNEWYQHKYKTRYQLARDKSGVQKFENTRSGYRIATSVGGVTTGEGADIVICDDPLKAEDGNSDVKRGAANRWWDETMTSRLNNLKTGAKVIIMQRLHEDDLTGHILADGRDYDWLCLPMEYESDRVIPPTSLGFVDPRTQDGELLCAERAGPVEVETLKNESTEYSWNGQYQQRPSPRGGGMFRIDKLETIDALPDSTRGHLVRCRAWDRAGTAGGGARTAGILMARDFTTNTYYIEDAVVGQWATDERERITLETARKDGKYVRILLEQEPGSSGLDSVRATIRMLHGFAVIAKPATGSKPVRAEPLATQISINNVKIVRGAWNTLYLKELENFPLGRFKDQTDASSLGFNWLSEIEIKKSSSAVSPPAERFVPR